MVPEEWMDPCLREEVLSISTSLSRAKHRLNLLESENASLKKLKVDLSEELSLIQEKVKESEILNKFLLEDHSKESLMDSVLGQIKSLRELKMEDKIKSERFKADLEDFLKKQTDERQVLADQGERLEGYLLKAKGQIRDLKVPDFEKMVKRHVDVQQIERHNRDLKVAEKLGPKQKMRGSQMMRRSTQYSSTGRPGEDMDKCKIVVREGVV